LRRASPWLVRALAYLAPSGKASVGKAKGQGLDLMGDLPTPRAYLDVSRRRDLHRPQVHR